MTVDMFGKIEDKRLYRKKKIPQKLEGSESIQNLFAGNVSAEVAVKNSKIAPQDIVKKVYNQFDTGYMEQKPLSKYQEFSTEEMRKSQAERVLQYMKAYKEFCQKSKPDELERAVQELSEKGDIHWQIQCSAKLILIIRNLLGTLPKQENNYKRQLLLLLHGALKRNYSKRIFNKEQTMLFGEIAKTCKEEFVSVETYYKYDEKMYEADLEVMSTWE